jgi:hypothetical protein
MDLSSPGTVKSIREKYGLQDRRILCSSDAHHLWDIREAANSIEIADEPYSSQRVRDELIRMLREGMV